MPTLHDLGHGRLVSACRHGNKELRSQFARMQLALNTPREYGLRVAAHSIMKVTADNKQRYATQRQVGFAGEGKIQTVLFRDPTTIDHNATVTDNLLEAIGAGTVSVEASGELWAGVPGRTIAEYLQSLTFPPENHDIEGGQLAGYIEDQVRLGELTDWTVFLATGDQTDVQLGGRTIKGVKRTARDDRISASRFVVRSILNPNDESIDLTDEEFAEALTLTNEERRLSDQAPTNRPSGPSVRSVRGKRPRNGLLIIYPIDPVIAEVDTPRPLIGVVISFPESAAALQRLYVENTVSRRDRQP